MQHIQAVRNVLIGGLLVMCIKIGAYVLTRSNAILTDALESIVNIAAGFFTLFSLTIAARPRDENHPYGHGKIEYFSAGFEGGLITVAGIAILIKAIESIVHPKPLHHLDWGIFLILVSGALNGLMGAYLLNVSKKNNSIAVAADGKHLISDALSSAVLIVGLAILYFTELYWLDSLLSSGMAIFICVTGIKLVRKSIGGLMDEVDAEVLHEIVLILNKNRKPEWIDIHYLRTQQHGTSIHIDCHVTLPFYLRFDETFAHYQAIENKLVEEFTQPIEVSIYPEPCTPHSCRLCQIQECAFRSSDFESAIEWTTLTLARNENH